jgi:hypothetical protein
MKKISLAIAAAAFAVVPLAGAQAEWQDPRDYGFETERVVPQTRIRNQGNPNAYIFDGENVSQ